MGPWMPKAIETWLLAMFGAKIGITSGLTRDGPLQRHRRDVAFDRRDAAAAGVHHHGDTVAVFVGDLQLCVGERLPRGGDREVGEAVHAADRFGIHERFGVEIGNLGGDLDQQDCRCRSAGPGGRRSGRRATPPTARGRRCRAATLPPARSPRPVSPSLPLCRVSGVRLPARDQAVPALGRQTEIGQAERRDVPVDAADEPGEHLTGPDLDKGRRRRR